MSVFSFKLLIKTINLDPLKGLSRTGVNLASWGAVIFPRSGHRATALSCSKGATNSSMGVEELPVGHRRQ